MGVGGWLRDEPRAREKARPNLEPGSRCMLVMGLFLMSQLVHQTAQTRLDGLRVSSKSDPQGRERVGSRQGSR